MYICTSCVLCEGETGLLVSKITEQAPFLGYVGNEAQTEKKRLRELYFNSRDLLRLDLEGFLYFQDHVGDTFRSGTQTSRTTVWDISLGKTDVLLCSDSCFVSPWSP